MPINAVGRITEKHKTKDECTNYCHRLVFVNVKYYVNRLTFLGNKFDEITFYSDRKSIIVTLSWWSTSEKQYTITTNGMKYC